MSDKPNPEAGKKEEEKMDSVETKKEEKAIEEEIGFMKDWWYKPNDHIYKCELEL